MKNIKSFVDNYKGTCDVLYILSGMSYKGIARARKILNIPKKIKKIKTRVQWADNIGVMSDKHEQEHLSIIVDTLCYKHRENYEKLFITEPHTLLFPFMMDILEEGTKRPGWSVVAFPGVMKKKEELLKICPEELELKQSIRFNDLGVSKSDYIMVFYDKTYSISNYRVIICKGDLFESFEYNKSRDYGFVSEIAQEVGRVDEGLSLYAHKFNTFYTER
jgi:hypothetical protein